MPDPRSIRLYIGSIAVLTALALLCYRIAWYPVPAANLVGTYHLASVLFLKVDALPRNVVFQEDGHLVLYAPDGALAFDGTWELDEKERLVRVNDPQWDRRFRIRSTLLGPRLCMRVSELPFDIDHHEHDEEVDLIRD